MLDFTNIKKKELKAALAGRKKVRDDFTSSVFNMFLCFCLFLWAETSISKASISTYNYLVQTAGAVARI